MSTETLLQPPDRVLSTMERDGSRRWLHPRLAKGRFLTQRRAVAYLLIAVFTLLPYLKINGKPAMLLDIVARRFTLFGYTFHATDTILFAILMVSIILSVFFVTAIAGRVWCGWACPQTVYMEFVYRPIERLFLGRSGQGGRPSAAVPGWRKALMYLSFFLISCFLAHTFLAYFVGVEQLRVWVTRSPIEHPVSFAVMALTTGLMLFDFVYFREQTCIIACPYGRLQSVLLDKWSLIISYDAKRGEPRGKMKKELRVTSCELRVLEADSTAQSQLATRNSQLTTHNSQLSSGDCIDCNLCVAVCPTGIDIREGLQLECVACAQCIDACDAIMDRVGRPRGLIRYSSQSALAGETPRILRPRVIIYSLILLVLASLLGYLMATKAPADIMVFRSKGAPYRLLANYEVENDMRLEVANRTDKPQTYRFAVVDVPGARIEGASDSITVPPGQARMEPFRLIAPAGIFKNGAAKVKLQVTDPNGVKLEKMCPLLGPF